MPTRLIRCFAAFLLMAIFTRWAPAENWPRFRGPNADGVALDHERLPTEWSTTKNVKWVVDVPGWGWSCPVVWGNRVFISTVASDAKNVAPKKGLYLGRGRSTPAKGVHHWLVLCFDLSTGQRLWKREVHRESPRITRHPKSTYASETPVTDGKHVYVLFGDLGLFCFDFHGKLRWTQKIEAKKTFFDYGAAGSPILYQDQVIYVYDNQEQSYITSVDANTGKVRWLTLRNERSTWATPYVWKNRLRTEIVTAGKRKIRSYDTNGKLIWEMNGRMSNLIIPSPFAAHGLLYVGSGYVGDFHRPVYAFRPGASGDITPAGKPAESKHIQWYQPQASAYNPSALVYGKYYYTLLDRGMMTCYDALSGKRVYGKKRFAPSASFTASPFAYNGKLFFLSEDGDTYVVEPGRKHRVIGKNSLGELCLSTPAISRGNLLIRTVSKLYCISKK